jgi:hypothetical protein
VRLRANDGQAAVGQSKRWSVTMASLDLISKAVFAVWLPLIYAAIGAGIIETLLAWGHHPWCFKGAYLLRSIEVPGGFALPEWDEPPAGRVQSLQYRLLNEREILFAGWPGFFRSGYLLKGKAVDLGGMTRVQVRAPLSMCLAVGAFCAVFLGLTLSSSISDGLAAGAVWLVLAAVVLLLFRWRIRQHAAAAPGCLEAILEHIRGQAEDGEAD